MQEHQKLYKVVTEKSAREKLDAQLAIIGEKCLEKQRLQEMIDMKRTEIKRSAHLLKKNYRDTVKQEQLAQQAMLSKGNRNQHYYTSQTEWYIFITFYVIFVYLLCV